MLSPTDHAVSYSSCKNGIKNTEATYMPSTGDALGRRSQLGTGLKCDGLRCCRLNSDLRLQVPSGTAEHPTQKPLLNSHHSHSSSSITRLMHGPEDLVSERQKTNTLAI
ncbi:hypothetical protein KIL84_002820 [Mauremys mutica]|uniref:Uncharacterized protein n=1 Tax=Mauremys mutica TaxID=74926 RepID=A0A9D4AMK4_9SAUR|nr:hypothetical protein KIL84_002820 [Mauremys mutica]